MSTVRGGSSEEILKFTKKLLKLPTSERGYFVQHWHTLVINTLLLGGGASFRTFLNRDPVTKIIICLYEVNHLPKLYKTRCDFCFNAPSSKN